MLTLKVATGLPLAWSAISGVLVGLFAGSVSWAFGGEYSMQIALVAGAGAAGAAWLLGLRWILSRLEPEQVRPPKHTAPVRVAFHSEPSGRVMTIAHITTADEVQLGKIARKVHNGERITTASMSPIFGGSRTAMHDFREEMLSQGFMRWNHPTDQKQGISVTSKGRAMLRAYLTTPPPDKDGVL